MAMTARRVLLALLVVTAVAAPVVAVGGWWLTGRAQVVELDGDVVVLVSERTGDGMSALLGGQLTARDGCVGINGDTVVWPPGTEVVDAEPLTLDVPDVGEVRLGDEIAVGGGYVWESTSGGDPPDPFETGGVTVPARCVDNGVWLGS